MNANRGLRAALAAACLLLAAALPLAASVVPACATTDDRAALVIDNGVDVLDLCVVLPSGSVSGIDLIELAAQQHGLDYRLGFGGQGVCRLDGVGPADGDCFSDYPDYWGYWRGDGNGGWSWSSVGAGSTIVRPGDIDAWSWGTGQDGSSHPAPPVTTESAVCPARSPSTPPTPSPTVGGGSHHQGSGNAGGGGSRNPSPSPVPSVTRAAPRHPHVSPSRRSPGSSATSASPASGSIRTGTIDGSIAALGTGADGGGPPTGVIAAVLAIVLLSAGAWAVSRRRVDD